MAWDPAETVARSALYKLLSLAFLPPETGIAQLFSGIDRILGASPNGHRVALGGVLGETGIVPDRPAAVEHTRLFGVGLAATPYETEYDSLASARKGHRLADLEGFYEAFGFRVARKEFADHIAVELEFMSLLLLKAAHAAAEGMEEPRGLTEAAAVSFLADHLGAWGVALADRLEVATGDAFYRFAARWLREFLLAECRFLGVEFEPMAGVPSDESGPLTCPFAPGCAENSALGR